MSIPLSVVFECQRFRLALLLELMSATEVTQQIDRMFMDRPDRSSDLFNQSMVAKITDRTDLIHQLNSVVDGRLPPQLGFYAANRALLLMQPKIRSSEISRVGALCMLVRLVEHGRNLPQWFNLGVSDLTSTFEKAKSDLSHMKSAERELDRFVIRAIMHSEPKTA